MIVYKMNELNFVSKFTFEFKIKSPLYRCVSLQEMRANER